MDGHHQVDVFPLGGTVTQVAVLFGCVVARLRVVHPQVPGQELEPIPLDVLGDNQEVALVYAVSVLVDKELVILLVLPFNAEQPVLVDVHVLN